MKRAAHLPKLTERAKTLARLSGSPEHKVRANDLENEGERLRLAKGRRAARQRGEGPRPKRELRREYDSLLLKLGFLTASAWQSPYPVAVKEEAEGVVCRLMDLAKLMGMSTADRPSCDQWLAEVEQTVRVRTENTGALIRERLAIIKAHVPRRADKRRCYCMVCICVRQGQMNMAGEFVEPKKERKR